ncbi:MAG TPA: SCO family protein, partial [Thermodesulfobacteriota bacterium]|nr:SCO family protein [Thermodesulfobacteriota bacterium]
PAARPPAAAAGSGAAGAPVSLETLGVYGRVPDFALVERSGRTVTLADLLGTVWVANFIYTACTDTCPTQSLLLSRLQVEFAGEPDLRLVSITVDPEHDTPAALARYAARYRADPARWLFLTGPKPAVHALAKEGFRLGVSELPDPRPASGWRRLVEPRPAAATHGASTLVLHSARVVLVDREGRIRAYHRPEDPESAARLRDNLRTLLAGG